MRSALKPVLLATLLLATACDEGEDELGTDSSVNMVGGMPGLAGGSDAAPPGTAGGPGGTTGGSVGFPGAMTGGPGSTGGAPDASVAMPGGGTSGLGDSGVAPGRDGGAAMTGGTQGGTGGGDAGSGPGPMVSGPGPVIPKVNGQCPVFQSGVTMIHGLSVNVYAGPKTPGKAGPLVFHWHGTGGKGDNVEKNPFGDGDEGAGLPAEVRAEILAEGGIIISPTDDESVRDGTDVTLILGVWYTPGDLELADLVTACAVEQQLIDPRRIYTTGCSAGGLMAGVMAFHRSSYLAASVPNSGGIVDFPGMSTFQDAHVPPSMTMHGLQGTDWVIVDFAETSAAMNNALVAKGGFAIDCDHGGGHCAAPKALKLAMWQFMKDHPFGVSPEPYANGLPASFPSYCKIIKQ